MLQMEEVSHKTLGFPKINMTDWMDTSIPPTIPSGPAKPLKPLKNPEIPILSDYKTTPDKSFWDIFPSQPLPNPGDPLTEVNVAAFELYASRVWQFLTPDQKDEFETVSHSLRFG